MNNNYNATSWCIQASRPAICSLSARCLDVEYAGSSEHLWSPKAFHQQECFLKFFYICLFLMVCSICNSALAYGQFLSLSAGVRFLGLISDRGTRARRGIGETEQMCGVLLITRAEIRALGEERWRGGIHYWKHWEYNKETGRVPFAFVSLCAVISPRSLKKKSLCVYAVHAWRQQVFCFCVSVCVCVCRQGPI